jgi:hypothetical protein
MVRRGVCVCGGVMHDRCVWCSAHLPFALSRGIHPAPARSVVVLNTLVNTTQWESGFPTHPIEADIHNSGGMNASVPGLLWSLNGTGGQSGAKIIRLKTPGLRINTTATPTLRFYWRLSSNEQVARAVILRMGTTSNVDYHASELQLFPRLDAVAAANNTAGDSFGQLFFFCDLFEIFRHNE